jgi:hypothetical protein
VRICFDKNVPRIAQRLLAKHEACDFLLALLLIFGVLVAAFQGVPTPPEKLPPNHQPTCSPDALCFSGEVSEGREFRKPLTLDLEFLLQPGWKIAVAPGRAEDDCHDLVSILNALKTDHVDANIDTAHNWKAEDEVRISPRQFRFVTNCADYRTESRRLSILRSPNLPQRIYRETKASLWTSPLGIGRLWITGSRVSHAADTQERKLGRIEWLRFTVEIRLPR